MKIGKQGLEMIKEYEGLKLQAYLPTPIDVPTIGYGHTKTAYLGMKVTEKGAEALLKQDLKWVEDVVAKNVTVPLTQPQYDALCSFIYNLGGTNFKRSTLLKKLNNKDYKGAADELLRWDKQGSKVLRGLTRRREAERALFLSEPMATSPAPTQGPLGALIAALVAIFKNRGA